MGMEHGSTAFGFIDIAIRRHRSRRSRCSRARWGWPLARPQEAHQCLAAAEVLSTSAGRVGLPSVQQARQPTCQPGWTQRQGVTPCWDPRKRMGELFEQVRPHGTHRSARTPQLEVGRDRDKATRAHAWLGNERPLGKVWVSGGRSVAAQPLPPAPAPAPALPDVACGLRFALGLRAALRLPDHRSATWTWCGSRARCIVQVHRRASAAR